MERFTDRVIIHLRAKLQLLDRMNDSLADDKKKDLFLILGSQISGVMEICYELTLDSNPLKSHRPGGAAFTIGALENEVAKSEGVLRPVHIDTVIPSINDVRRYFTRLIDEFELKIRPKDKAN